MLDWIRWVYKTINPNSPTHDKKKVSTHKNQSKAANWIKLDQIGELDTHSAQNGEKEKEEGRCKLLKQLLRHLSMSLSATYEMLLYKESRKKNDCNAFFWYIDLMRQIFHVPSHILKVLVTSPLGFESFLFIHLYYLILLAKSYWWI